MRKFILTLACCVLAGMAACGGNDEKTIDNGTPTKAPSQNNETVGTDNQNPAQTPAQDDKTEPEKTKGYVFTYKGTDVVIDADATTYVTAFGEPVSYYETPSCAFDNLDKFYTYQGFEIDTYYMDGKDLVLSVVLLDDTVSTTEGICIGDAQDKVKTVYGEPAETTDNSATYKKDNMKLVFIFKDGAVAAIEYKSLVLDAQ